MIPCLACKEPATIHLTEIAGGKPVEYHVCEKHVSEVQSLQPAAALNEPFGSFRSVWSDPALQEAFCDEVARDKLAAYLLPALCLGLIDGNPHVRILSVFQMLHLAGGDQSVLGALRDASNDHDERVRRIASSAVRLIEAASRVSPIVYGQSARKQRGRGRV